MEKNDTTTLSSRAERIRIARESCIMRLDSLPGPKVHLKETVNTVNTSEVLPEPILKIRFFLLRLCCAAVIFAAVFLMDHFKVSYNGFDSSKIAEAVQSNHSIEQVEDCISVWISTIK